MIKYYSTAWIEAYASDDKMWVRQEDYAEHISQANMKYDALADDLAAEQEHCREAVAALAGSRRCGELLTIAQDRIRTLEAELARSRAANVYDGNAHKRVADLEDRIRSLEAALRDIENRCRWHGNHTPERIREIANKAIGSELETPVSTLCAVCDQIKELHPSTHPWTAKETPAFDHEFIKAANRTDCAVCGTLLRDHGSAAETACKHMDTVTTEKRGIWLCRACGALLDDSAPNRGRKP